MTYDEWLGFRESCFKQYSCPAGHFRIDIELDYPKNSLYQVPVECEPHRYYDSHECFYVCDEWSTIFGVHETNGRLRMLVESGHEQPWGEKIRLMSTSCSIVDPWWQKNTVNKFAFFRGKYWRLTWCEFLNDFPAGFGRMPIQDRRHYSFPFDANSSTIWQEITHGKAKSVYLKDYQLCKENEQKYILHTENYVYQFNDIYSALYQLQMLEYIKQELDE